MGSTQVGIVKDLARYPPQDPAARKDLYNAALDLLYAVESSQDTAQRLYHGHLPLAMAQTGIDLHLFEAIAAKQDKNWTIGELASETGADQTLLYRIVRCLSSYGMISQNPDSTFTASNITRNLSLPNFQAGIKHYSLTMTQAYQAIPRFLASTNYCNPSSATSTPFNLAYKTEMPVFEWRKHNPENAKAGQAFMAAQRMGQRSVWEGRVPVKDFVLSEADVAGGRVSFCDVGGGMGHQCLDLRKYQPSLKGKMVTEDLSLAQDMIPASTREEMKLLDIDIVPHDFMTEQPVKNAKVYYLRNVIHNWNDEPSVVILSHIRQAMATDSVVIIDDVVMPTVGATWKQASMDIAMMTMLAAMERTKEDFEVLLQKAGLRLRDVWTYDEEYGDSLIVAVPAGEARLICASGEAVVVKYLIKTEVADGELSCPTHAWLTRYGSYREDSDSSALASEAVTTLAANSGLKLKDSHIKDWSLLLGSLGSTIDKVTNAGDYTLKPDLNAYPRTSIRIPASEAESDKGGWATLFEAKALKPKTSLLEGKTIALKDNIAFAGVRCTNGTKAIEWTPEIDATVATRILDASGLVTGKAACENACMEGVSDTSCTGKVQNPYADGYSCGGSSSGSGRLVGSGAVDMALGGDQGGSIRIPAANCGIVGLKPTWGLVPYTGILSLESTIDHVGPMTKTVRDAALLLDVIAGKDGIDDRQPYFLPEAYMNYTAALDDYLSSASKDKPLLSIKLGILSEGFDFPGMESSVSTLCKRAVDKLSTLGAEIKQISIPLHSLAAEIWMLSLPLSGAKSGLLGLSEGRKMLSLNDRPPLSSLTQSQFDALGPGAQNLYMRYLYLNSNPAWKASIHGKTNNLLRQINDAYDDAFKDVDILVMPTLPSPPCRLFDDPENVGPLERLGRNVGLVTNTAPFDSTGHPALTVPVGYVDATDEEGKGKAVRLPIGIQFVGKKFCENDVFKVGAVWEGEVDWKTF
ncbi:Amidase [Pseudocercospora fuligena]|uniref:Amidase n=1 Tax=Pseudocercospora fuligena TaxID=685502 RepID=A0A8H6VS04_9PEZI|nr:Amidase [Pseudocercospora fuligena]